ncbi:MAG: VCBS repeat-containing protein [Planctomycetota bacterium]
MRANAALFLALAAASAPAMAQTVLRDVSGEYLPPATHAGRIMDCELIDLNADGRLDIVLAHEYGPNKILVATDSGAFVHRPEALDAGLSNDSEDIAFADFDADGLTDIVFAAEDDSNHEIYFRLAGDSTDDIRFENVSANLRQKIVGDAVIALDFDNDGDRDFIISGHGDELAARNDGKGNFVRDNGVLPTGADPDGDITQDLEAGDIDGDGDLDIVLGNEGPNRVFINNGDGTFGDESDRRLPASGRSANSETRELDLGDVDGDGDLDLMVANTGWKPTNQPANQLFLNDGRGRFTEAPADALPGTGNDTTSIDVDLVDLDGDGDLDALFANFNQDRPLQIWTNDGAGNFRDVTAQWVPPMSQTAGVDIEVHDFNGDGLMDLYMTNYVGPDKLLLQRGQ